MPFPNEETQFKPGESGNPEGYSQGRRLRDEYRKFVRDNGRLEIMAITIFAMSTGYRELLKDPETGEERKPDLKWMDLAIELHDGPRNGRDTRDDDTATTPRTGPHTIPDLDPRFEPPVDPEGNTDEGP